MENKPVFCSECGAKLTGSAQFCASCGAKQEEAAAVEVAPVSPAPDNSLAAPKAKISVFGLILTLAALGATLLAIILQIIQVTVIFGKNFSVAAIPYLEGQSLSMVLAWVVPLAAIVAIFVKNKKLATAGLILAGVSLVVQFIFMIVYMILMIRGVDLSKVSFLLRSVNGESLFLELWRLIRNVGHISGKGLTTTLLSLGASLCFFLKNILAAVACLLVATKKTK